jgi:acetylornithine/succinyldiaminopimelate/putrescine aminotransferase
LKPDVPRINCGYAEVLEPGSAAAADRIRRGDLAAVILEPIQGAAGFQELPAPWLADVARACRERGTMLVSDEIQVGLGRTGTFTGLERAGLRADMYVFSKALGGGLFPLSALVARPGILPHSLTDSEGFGSTFSQNQFGMRIADAVLDLLDRTLATTDIPARGALLCNTIASGGRLEGRARTRHYGLAVALDFETADLASAFRERAFAEHILFCHVSGAAKNVVRMFPPLNTSEAELVELGERLGKLVAALPR